MFGRSVGRIQNAMQCVCVIIARHDNKFYNLCVISGYNSRAVLSVLSVCLFQCKCEKD